MDPVSIQQGATLPPQNRTDSKAALKPHAWLQAPGQNKLLFLNDDQSKSSSSENKQAACFRAKREWSFSDYFLLMQLKLMLMMMMMTMLQGSP